MLESLAAWVLNTYIGEYLENLNTSQLSIGLLQGYAELENVPMKRTALRKFDLPLSVRAGVIGKLTLSVPLTHLKSEPWVVTVNDLYVVLEPSHQYDMEFEAQFNQEKKAMQLEALELSHQKRLADIFHGGTAVDLGKVVDPQRSPSGSGWWAYGASVMSTIVENIQLIATNVHVRYEDNVTIPGRSFACGFKIGRFSVQSADYNWTPGFVLRLEGENRRKLMELKEFSVYWDTGGDMNEKLMMPDTFRDLVEKMKEIEGESDRHHYLLSPLGLRMKMEKNTSKIPLKTLPPSPRFQFYLEPDEVNLQGGRRQFTELRFVIEEWQRHQRGKPYRKWRPKAPLSRETTKQWWKFAIICHLDLIRQRNERRTWKYVYNRARQVNAYCKAYIRLLEDRPKFKTKDEVLMRQIEREYGFDELHFLRESAFRYGIRTGALRGNASQLSPSNAIGSSGPGVSLSPSSASLSASRSPVQDEAQLSNATPSTSYFAGWLGYWWSQQPPSQLPQENPQVLEPLQDDPQLRNEIQKVEQVLEEELWDMYNETVDDSAIMGRDLLFAAVNLSMKSLNIAFSGGYINDLNASETSDGDMHQCLSNASLDFGLRIKYLPDPTNRNVVTPCFELSAIFGSGLNLSFDNKQYETILQALAGWSASADLDQGKNVGLQDVGTSQSRKTSLAGTAKRLAAQGRSNSFAGLPSNTSRKISRKDRVDFQLLADIEIPTLKVDLRSDFSMDSSNLAARDQPLVSVLCDAVSVGYRKTKPHVCAVEICMASFSVIDLLEGSAKTPNLPHLVKASGGAKSPCTERIRSFLSTSCPDISSDFNVDDSSILLLSTSLPSSIVSPGFLSPELTHLFPATPPSTPTLHSNRSRGNESTQKEKPRSGVASTSSKSPHSRAKDKRIGQDGQERIDKESSATGPVCVTITLIDSVHEGFYNAYKQVGTQINVDAGDLDVVINQQTLIILLEFFGFLAPTPLDHAELRNGAAGEKKLQLDATIRTLKIIMNKPSEGYQLGNIVVDDLQACMIADEVGFSINGQANGVQLTDETPGHSYLYPEKLNLIAEEDKNVQFLFYKYKKADPELKREFDACLAVHADDDVNYVHTQRYLSDLIQFWNHFAQVYDLYSNAKAASLGFKKPDVLYHGFRLKLRIDMHGAKLFLPMSAHDATIMVALMNRLVADNDFLFSSLLEDEGQGTAHDPCDCLVDILQLHLEELRLYEGIRLPEDHSDPFWTSSTAAASIFAKERRQIVNFRTFAVLVDPENLIDRSLSLDVSVARNLDTNIARIIPDMAVHTSIESAVLRLRVDTYAMLRAMLEHNLAEELPAQPSSGSIAQITSCVTSGPWTSLEFTCELNNVFVDCLTASPADNFSAGVPQHFARIDFERVKFSFESFSNGVQHVDLIFNEGRVIDTRYKNEPGKQEGPFSTIWSLADSESMQSDNGPPIPKGDHLLGEIHFASEGHCATLTLVFSKARLLFVTEWFDLARSFFTTQATVHKLGYENGKVSTLGAVLSQEKSKLEKWKYHRTDMLSKTRVVTRAKLENMKKENFKFKATLLDSEIVFLEQPSSPDSLAVILKATASPYFEDVDGQLRFECWDGQLQLFDCFYRLREETTAALTNLFSCTAELAAQLKPAPSATYISLGLLESVPELQEYLLKVSLRNLMAKLSYRDYLVLRAIWDAYTAYQDQECGLAHRQSMQHKDNTGTTTINKFECKMESVSVCFLDDYEGTRFPLFKLSINDAIIEDKLGRSSLNTREGRGSFVIEVNYFNQKVYGWEPFLELWRVDNVTWGFNPVSNALNLDIAGNKLLDVTVTKTFIQQARHFLSYWPSVSEALATNFRSGFMKRLDILPYLLVNQTGSVLSFETFVSGQRQSGASRNRSASRWTVNDGEQCQFSFESDSWAEDDTPDPFLSHHIIIRVDGWHEISSIPVDAVGTFFRLARLDGAKKSALSNAVSYTRLVAAVSIDQDGRKVVTIRSALMLVNGLGDALTVRLEVTSFVGEYAEFVLPAGAVRPAPLAFANSKIFVRPGPAFSYCKPITWSHVNRREQTSNYIRTCAGEGKQYKICVSIKAESYPEIRLDNGVVPGHTLSFVPPLIVHNLLPLDLRVNVGRSRERVKIPGGQWLPFVEVDPTEIIELNFETEYFHSRQPFCVHPTAFQEQKQQLEMIDQLRRPLLLTAKLTPIKGEAAKVTISAPFWFVNKSALPLVIKQEATEEAAGQFDEHERARSMTPVLFSFAESGAPLKCCLRLGKYVHPDCVSDWCRSFVLEPGITFKELRSVSFRSSGPSVVYNIGVEVRPGQGLYKDTNIVLLTARYLIDNRTSHKLHISQLYYAESKMTGQYTVAPNCSLAWHWPRQDLDLLLCVRQDEMPFWSSPFRIDQLKSFHLTLRDSQFVPQFLRLEIILRGSVYYVTFSSAENIPPPIRIENLTDVPILYNQKSCDANHLRAILRPQTKVNYSFDDPQFKPPIILLTAPYGKMVEYDLAVLGQGEPLLYENFIYIAFAMTLDESLRRNPDETELVLEVLSQGKVVVGKKDPHKPQQLWRMRSDGYLVNTADWSHLMKHTDDNIPFVLDILPAQCDGTAIVPLMLRRLDPNRNSTQRWRFTEDNRLVCGFDSTYVQAERGLLKCGTAAVLGPTQAFARSSLGAPPEQLIVRQRQRPGSGRLSVTVFLDGPTRVLRITDMSDQQNRRLLSARARLEHGPNSCHLETPSSGNTVTPALELAISCTLHVGVGFSVVNSDQEELIYCRLTGLILNARRENGKYTLGLKVLEIQADNQLWNVDRWTLLFIRSKFDEKHDPSILALDLLVQWAPLPSYDSFDTFVVNINKVALYVDEILLWKLLLFFDDDTALGSSANRLPVDKSSEQRRSEATIMSLYQQSPPPGLELDRPDPKESRRCYFGILNLSCQRLYLSVVTANVLGPELRRVKQMYNMPLIRFENASVDVSPFQQSYYFETLNFLLEALHKHFTQQLRSQAIKILGTVDFLGNPVGLFRDVSDSIQEFMISGNVSSFVTGIMHGFSNSAAKITSSLSDQVGKIAMDDEHRQFRESVRQSQSQDAMGHLLGGVKGLVIGVFGGVTSVITEPVGGVKRDGLEGLFTGVGKGVIGMVAKPVQGVLDLATGVSNATREAVSGSDGPLKSRFRPTRLRFPRVARSLQGTLPPYSEQLATAQRTLLSINDGNLRELCLSMDQCYTPQQQTPVLVLISTTNVYFVRRHNPDDVRVLLNIAYSLLQGCTGALENLSGDQSLRSIASWQQPFLEFTLKTSDPSTTKRRIRCDSVEKSADLCQKILYAKQQYEELERSLAIPEHYAVDQL